MRIRSKLIGLTSNVSVLCRLKFHITPIYGKLFDTLHSLDLFFCSGPLRSLGFLHFDLEELKKKRGPVLHHIVASAYT